MEQSAVTLLRTVACCLHSVWRFAPFFFLLSPFAPGCSRDLLLDLSRHLGLALRPLPSCLLMPPKNLSDAGCWHIARGRIPLCLLCTIAIFAFVFLLGTSKRSSPLWMLSTPHTNYIGRPVSVDPYRGNAQKRQTTSATWFLTIVSHVKALQFIQELGPYTDKALLPPPFSFSGRFLRLTILKTYDSILNREAQVLCGLSHVLRAIPDGTVKALVGCLVSTISLAVTTGVASTPMSVTLALTSEVGFANTSKSMSH